MPIETLDIASDLRRSLAALNRRLRQAAREPGMSATKHSVLGHLYRQGRTTPSALAQAEGVQPQTLSRVLSELVESGLASRRRDNVDRRQYALEITAQGRDALRRDAHNRSHWLAGAMESRLTPVERQILALAAQLFDRLSD